MAKFEFMKESKHNRRDWYYTKKDGVNIDNSGDYDYEKALEMYELLISGGSLDTINTILKTHELNEEN